MMKKEGIKYFLKRNYEGDMQKRVIKVKRTEDRKTVKEQRSTMRCSLNFI